MIFEKMLSPDVMFDKFSSVTPDVLARLGIGALVCDIDNTLATYDDVHMPEAVAEWLKCLAGAGIGVALISNNTPERVKTFIGDFDVPVYPDAHKPSRTYFLEALEHLGAKAQDAAVLGDQLLTDAWAAHRVGMRALIVPPIKDRTGLFFRFKRALEKPYVRRFAKTGGFNVAGTIWGA